MSQKSRECLDTMPWQKRKNEIQQFISNRLVYERFSPFEQHGCSAGGTTHVIATLLAGAEVDANSLTAPINSFQGEQQCAKKQIERIRKWAIATNCWIDDVDIVLSNQFGEQIAEGGKLMFMTMAPLSSKSSVWIIISNLFWPWIELVFIMRSSQKQG